MIWNRFTDEWLVRPQARIAVGTGAVLCLLLSVSFLGVSGPTATMSFGERLYLTVVACLGTLGALFLWLGMWRYWVRLDKSRRQHRRLWFIVLLAGCWYGSMLYFVLAYLPQTSSGGSSKLSRWLRWLWAFFLTSMALVVVFHESAVARLCGRGLQFLFFPLLVGTGWFFLRPLFRFGMGR